MVYHLSLVECSHPISGGTWNGQTPVFSGFRVLSFTPMTKIDVQVSSPQHALLPPRAQHILLDTQHRSPQQLTAFNQTRIASIHRVESLKKVSKSYIAQLWSRLLRVLFEYSPKLWEDLSV